MYYIYILYSDKADKFYVGYSPDPNKRLQEHNEYTDNSKYTAKYKPWELVCFFEVSQNRSDAIKVERFIKKQKSRLFLEKVIKNHLDNKFINSIIRKAVR